jgi:SEC-C motif
MQKVGRNDPCPCGSGKKYKKCHGNHEHLARINRIMTTAPTMLARHQAQELQRTSQQGLGKPIISARMENGHQFIAVNNQLYVSEKWNTFHDFLLYYIRVALGEEWGNTELKKPLNERHPILNWYDKVCEQQRLSIKTPGVTATAQMTGAVAAYLNLAYDLYALAHNAELQTKLVGRLRNSENFPGARYEVYVAAKLIRAGFELEFENEDDRSTSHCEFTATYQRTGKRFSVEAKHTQSNRIIRALGKALKKNANHKRIVFISLNKPESAITSEIPHYAQTVFDELRRFEKSNAAVEELPAAYVFITNSSWEHHLDSTTFGQFILAEGFNIPEFKMDHEYPSLTAAIDSRTAHIEMHELLKSIRMHSDIPSTFNGENPEQSPEENANQLLIGNSYKFSNEDGIDVDCVLKSAVVNESKRTAMCAVVAADGKSFLVEVPLSDSELAAWKRHPDTFFGEISRNRKCETILDLYDFFLETYSKSSKAMLLNLLKDHSDVNELANLEQPSLARIYCERMASSAYAISGSPKKEHVLKSKSSPVRSMSKNFS